MKISIKKSSLAALFLGSSAFFSGCGNDEEHNHPANNQEVITTLRLNLTHPTDSAKNQSIAFMDLDGDGGTNGIILPDTLRLQPNTLYKASLEVLDESNAAGVHDIADEIREESTAHQFFYVPSQGLNITVSNLDHDTNHKPLGLKADFSTLGASHGSLRISLNHYGEVAKDGVTPSGDTDIEVTFPVSIQ